MVNLAQEVEHRSVDSEDLVRVQSFTLFFIVKKKMNNFTLLTLIIN